MILDFNKSGAWNKRGGAKFGPFLINVVAEITELWVGNSQKINCRNFASIREGRVMLKILRCLILFLMFTCNNFLFCAFVTMINWTSTEVLLNLVAPLD